ncbi:hypothetical protein IE81DRAFT_330594 [Ceraceosorus guamensis]|uniref:WW domain-containing protein n=1 Tax=Ceraceosorus guamensis TaxID=1522189 RepID=A0A316W024_9BASI|nr:hypothetical protein IE81DRAFT_330594 [Ceraceosorus guamensis]PWN41901.1 hypothetical protein IE81DRAFT_330594 [Ceraceosorus guamensis]
MASDQRGLLALMESMTGVDAFGADSSREPHSVPQLPSASFGPTSNGPDAKFKELLTPRTSSSLPGAMPGHEHDHHPPTDQAPIDADWHEVAAALPDSEPYLLSRAVGAEWETARTPSHALNPIEAGEFSPPSPGWSTIDNHRRKEPEARAFSLHPSPLLLPAAQTSSSFPTQRSGTEARPPSEPAGDRQASPPPYASSELFAQDQAAPGSQKISMQNVSTRAPVEHAIPANVILRNSPTAALDAPPEAVSHSNGLQERHAREGNDSADASIKHLPHTQIDAKQVTHAANMAMGAAVSRAVSGGASRQAYVEEAAPSDKSEGEAQQRIRPSGPREPARAALATPSQVTVPTGKVIDATEASASAPSPLVHVPNPAPFPAPAPAPGNLSNIVPMSRVGEPLSIRRLSMPITDPIGTPAPSTLPARIPPSTAYPSSFDGSSSRSADFKNVPRPEGMTEAEFERIKADAELEARRVLEEYVRTRSDISTTLSEFESTTGPEPGIARQLPESILPPAMQSGIFGDAAAADTHLPAIGHGLLHEPAGLPNSVPLRDDGGPDMGGWDPSLPWPVPPTHHPEAIAHPGATVPAPSWARNVTSHDLVPLAYKHQAHAAPPHLGPNEWPQAGDSVLHGPWGPPAEVAPALNADHQPYESHQLHQSETHRSPAVQPSSAFPPRIEDIATAASSPREPPLGVRFPPSDAGLTQMYPAAVPLSSEGTSQGMPAQSRSEPSVQESVNSLSAASVPAPATVQPPAHVLVPSRSTLELFAMQGGGNLPSGWSVEFDAVHQAFYFVNLSTTPPTSTWHDPRDGSAWALMQEYGYMPSDSTAWATQPPSGWSQMNWRDHLIASSMARRFEMYEHSQSGRRGHKGVVASELDREHAAARRAQEIFRAARRAPLKLIEAAKRDDPMAVMRAETELARVAGARDRLREDDAMRAAAVPIEVGTFGDDQDKMRNPWLSRIYDADAEAGLNVGYKPPRTKSPRSFSLDWKFRASVRPRDMMRNLPSKGSNTPTPYGLPEAVFSMDMAIRASHSTEALEGVYLGDAPSYGAPPMPFPLSASQMRAVSAPQPFGPPYFPPAM